MKGTEQTHIYKVSFKKAPFNGGKTDFLFGSLSAIYDSFTREQIGCKVSRLWNYKVTPEHPYIGRKCTITKEPFMRKKHNQ